MNALVVVASLLIATTSGQQQPPGVTQPIVEDCGFGDSVVCVNKYAAVLPYHFNRSITSLAADYDFRNTTVPNAPTFQLLQNASFVVFDRDRGLQYLGPEPTYEFVFQVGNSVHEAPVYVPSLNKLFMSQLPPVAAPISTMYEYLPQLVVDLGQEPLTLQEYVTDPPIFAPNGGIYHNGQIIWASSGGFNNLNGTEQRIALHSVDPTTNKSTVLLNNFFGFYFNNMDDVTVHPTSGDLFFTDPDYPWFNGRVDTAPQLPTASYRFNPTTGALFLIDDTIEQPNGIAFSPDGNTLYITETGSLTGSIDPAVGPGTKHYNTTGKRSIYAFDVANNGTKISNKRSFYMAQDYIPDGLKVSREGLVLTATGHGIDVIDDMGQLLLRVQTNHSVQNLQFTGPNLDTVWLMGNQGISRVHWNITGQIPK
ncbi:gluconolactonase [Cladophialophora psammophila CBS 110553]|uniref:Gluconolactonase n=1 Tax=Cladophialophora psammophila CBS 110553 TaxID=1182543 RepID=W9WYC0_9EURO|nr:gluconolactonase [Cladophialophora psammophila CBS 110553]EXJ70055.1 gluconolactonase [Cladophialophora psammophila CBS 110553]